MNFDRLPWVAQPVVGESRASWMRATRCQLGVSPDEWSRLVGADSNEPERERSGRWTRWQGLPAALGHVATVPRQWRLASCWRSLHCPQCVIRQGARRWPMYVEWLDARCIWCLRHRRLLDAGFHPVGSGSNPLGTTLEGLCHWLDSWRSMERSNGHELESCWRRDLVLAAMRNWSCATDHYGAIDVSDDLRSAGIQLQECAEIHPPDLPVRIGQLCPQARLATLLKAYRRWAALDGAEAYAATPMTFREWNWLGRRWCTRATSARLSRLRGLFHAEAF